MTAGSEFTAHHRIATFEGRILPHQDEPVYDRASSSTSKPSSIGGGS